MAGLVLSAGDRAYFLTLMRRQLNSAVHRRMNVLLLLDDGWSAERIAEALFIEAETVRDHHRALKIARRGVKATLYNFGFKPLYNLLPERAARSLAYKFSVTARRIN